MDLMPSISITNSTAATGGSSSGGGGGPAPFLLKTYEMVEDSSTDAIVSWSSSNNSFIVWNPLEFARLLLPTYFKHNNFSSFIRQLNTYGFHKIDPERWEFQNEEFLKDKKHLLKNIHRRKPIHSHSHPPPDPERAAFEEEIEKLTRHKNELDAKVSTFRMRQCLANSHLQDIRQRFSGMDQRQDKLLTLLHNSVQNPAFLQHLSQKIQAMDVSAYNKKRRLPPPDTIFSLPDTYLPDNQSHAANHHQHISSKLNLELSTAVSNINLVSNSTHTSNEDCPTPPTTKSLPIELEDCDMEINTLPYASETLPPSDPGTRLPFPLSSDKFSIKELSSVQQSVVLSEEEEEEEEGEGHICCQLNLSLASSSTQAQMDVDVGGENRDEIRASFKDNHPLDITVKSNKDSNPPRVNDVFWEQFLTERPGTSDAEEASSSYRALPNDEPEEKGSSNGMSTTENNLGKLTL